jgi:5'-methylthioadenosine phosphorylase
VVVNHAAGRGESAGGIRLEGIEQMLHQTIARARRVIEQLASSE